MSQNEKGLKWKLRFTWLRALRFVVSGKRENLIHNVLRDSVVLEEDRHEDGNVGDAEDVDSVAGQNLTSTLFTIEKDESRIDNQTLASQQGSGFEDAGTAGDDILIKKHG